MESPHHCLLMLFDYLAKAVELAEMRVFIHFTLLIAGLARASQVTLSSKPPTGNVPHSLPTERTFLLNVPAAYTHGEPHPLVLSFHGG
jgi:poly(3-hydroxybutyrate) depolymerase